MNAEAAAINASNVEDAIDAHDHMLAIEATRARGEVTLLLSHVSSRSLRRFHIVTVACSLSRSLPLLFTHRLTHCWCSTLLLLFHTIVVSGLQLLPLLPPDLQTRD